MTGGSIRTQRAAGTFFVVGVTAVISPIVNLWRDRPRDSFPLSHYPMFSVRRGDDITVTFLRGVLCNGAHRPLDSRLAARGGMNQERKQIARSARRDRGERLARRVARRLARRDRYDDVVAVEVVTGTFPLAAHFDGSGPCREVTVHGHHEIPGRGIGTTS